MNPTVYIVHAVDVEGPMTETLEATFERMRDYGLPENVAVSKENLDKIQDGCLSGIPDPLAISLKQVFNRHSLGYLTDWKQIDEALAGVMSDKFRQCHCSKGGEPYLFSWFIYDHHEGFVNNPRYHETGTHHLFDHYMDGPLKDNLYDDGIFWHYHHPAPSGDALESGTCWTNNAVHEAIIAKRIIERRWYFSCFRAGLHLERNDMSHWLEMFVPFDFSARYSTSENVYAAGGDFDWRGCSDRWGAWHPDWYDYRREGEMKRYLFRCTDLWTYLNRLKDSEVSEAFEQARHFGSSVLTYYNHDFRDMQSEIEEGYETITRVAERYPDVNWKFVDALQAAKQHLETGDNVVKLNCHIEDGLLEVKSDGDIFGPQPFLAIKEDGRYFRDNFTDEGNNRWCYRFRNPTKVEAVGIAANNSSGNYDLVVIPSQTLSRLRCGMIDQRETYWNDQYFSYWKQRVDESSLQSSWSSVTKGDHVVPADSVYEDILDQCKIRNGRMLDVGCGWGRFFSMFAKRKLAIYGVDISEKMVAEAHLAARQYGAEVQQSTAEALSFDSDFFDFVVCFGVFDATYQNKAIGEFLRVVKSGGLVVITGKNCRYHEDDQEARLAEDGAKRKGEPNYFTDVPLLITQLKSQGHSLVKEYYFSKRGDFGKCKYVEVIPDRFYEYCLVISKGTSCGVFKPFSLESSK